MMLEHLQHRKQISIDEFYHIRSVSNQLCEYIDRIIYMSPSPSTQHQRISMRLSSALFAFLQGKPCEVFSAPFDIELKREDIIENHVVIPDLSIICDKTGLTNQRYIGVPDLIIEILSPSTSKHDKVVKLNLYQKFGVKEYWIVDPLNEIIDVYRHENGCYQFPVSYGKSDHLLFAVGEDGEHEIDLALIFDQL